MVGKTGIFSKLHKLLLVVCRSFGSPHPFENLDPNTYSILRSLVTASIYVLYESFHNVESLRCCIETCLALVVRVIRINVKLFRSNLLAE